jgi:hypothetical protein
LSDRRNLSFGALVDMPKTRKKGATAPDAPITPQVGDKATHRAPSLLIAKFVLYHLMPTEPPD